MQLWNTLKMGKSGIRTGYGGSPSILLELDLGTNQFLRDLHDEMLYMRNCSGFVLILFYPTEVGEHDLLFNFVRPILA